MILRERARAFYAQALCSRQREYNHVHITFQDRTRRAPHPCSLKKFTAKSTAALLPYIYRSYLHVSIFPCKKSDGWQAGDDAALQDQNRRAHQPIEGHDARRVVLAGLAPFGARQAFKHSALGILALLALLTNVKTSFFFS